VRGGVQAWLGARVVPLQVAGIILIAFKGITEQPNIVMKVFGDQVVCLFVIIGLIRTVLAFIQIRQGGLKFKIFTEIGDKPR
jgi:hypothetical protein